VSAQAQGREVGAMMSRARTEHSRLCDLSGCQGREALEALAEAERIIARSEPAGAYAYHPDHQYFSPCDGWRYMGDVWLGVPQEGNAHAALAEAIAGALPELERLEQAARA
jgi:hypothetical protein